MVYVSEASGYGLNGLYIQSNPYKTMSRARTGYMKEITVHIPEPYLQVMDELVRRKYYLSRADLTLSTVKVGRFSVCLPNGFILPSSRAVSKAAPATGV
jgi:hypothetical protein